MENTVVQNTMSLLIDQKGFFLEEFKSGEDTLGFYLYTHIKNGYLAVIFSSLGREDENLAAFHAHAKAEGFNAYVFNIIFTKGHQVVPKALVPNYSEAYVDDEGDFYGLDDLGRLILGKPPIIQKRKLIEIMPITLGIMGLNILIYLATVFYSKSLDIDIRVLIDFGAKVNELIIQGEYYRLVTSAFLHADGMHILFNMYALFALGRILEDFLGKIKYSLIYLFSALTGGIFSYLYTPNVSVGASGAIFGLLGALLMVAIFRRNVVNKGLLPRIAIVLMISLFSGFSSGTTDNFGHIGGLIGGLVLSFVLLIFEKKKQENLV
ncbi:MAG: rhomboid family intramembrane serine protease [Clostridium sp.]|nr:rhomboid family intramembrane serine protease [Clostridium sp.]